MTQRVPLFVYVTVTHHSRRDIAACLIKDDINVDEVQTIWTRVWEAWHLAYYAGNLCFAAGFVLLAIVLVNMIAR